MFNRNGTKSFSLFVVIFVILAGLLIVSMAMGQTLPGKTGAATSNTVSASPKPEKLPTGPTDEYDRGNPRSSIKGFFKATRNGDYERAAQYLDLRHLPKGMNKQGPELARQLKVVLDRTMWIDLDIVSDSPKGMRDDGLPTYRDILGRIKTPKKTVDVLLQHVARKDGVYVWKFCNRTVAEIPHLYKHFGFKPFEEWLSKQLPDYTFLGWHTWQWVLFLVFIGLAYVGALLPTWAVGLILRQKDTEVRQQAAQLITGPVRILLWLLLVDAAIYLIGPSTFIRSMLKGGVFIIIAATWTAIGIMNLLFERWFDRMRKSEKESVIILLRPVKKILNIFLIIMAVLLWLGNIGFNISTLLAGLGVGGLAIALAAQDTLKNFIGSIMILLDKPYKIGQRIVVKDHDGVVEEIGLRSTRMRLLNGHQTTIPNEEMARVDIENIGRRPHIRRLTNIGITYDTPPEKAEKAVQIIRDILVDHKGMDEEFPPQVYFDEFNAASLNIIMLYWYHPPNYWDYLAFNQKVNLQIMEGFEKEGIKFAFPTMTTYLTQEKDTPLHINLDDGARQSRLSEESV